MWRGADRVDGPRLPAGSGYGIGNTPEECRPENIHTFLAQDSVLSTVLGSTDYLVLITIEEWPGCSVRRMARLCGHPESAIKAIIGRFSAVGLVEMNDEGLFYPTGVVQTFAEERDRLA